jgi:hypothetical protein
VVWIEELDSFVEATAGDSGDIVVPDICCPTRIQTSASKAARPNFEILRIMARAMSTAICMAIRAFVDSGVEPLETARTNDKRFSAVKTIPTQTKPICEMADQRSQFRISDRVTVSVSVPPSALQ